MLQEREGRRQAKVPVRRQRLPGKSFILEYTYNGWESGVNEQIISMAANASGIRDTARVLKVSKQKVSDTLKKRKKRQAGSTSST